MSAEIIEMEGRLFVRGEWKKDENRGVECRQTWPTGILADEYPDFVGKSVDYMGVEGMYVILGSMVSIQLENGEKTVSTEEVRNIEEGGNAD